MGDGYSTKAYWFYIEAYLSKDYSCHINNIIGRLYKYITSLYINYKEKRFTNSKDYKPFKVTKLVC